MPANNTNGRLSIWANTRGAYLGNKIVDGLNELVDQKDSDSIEGKLKLKRPIVTEWGNSFMSVELPESVKGDDAFLIQLFTKPANVKRSKYNAPYNLLEFLDSVYALLKSGVKRLTIMTPYAYHQRNDREKGRGSSLGSVMFSKLVGGIAHGYSVPISCYCLDIHSHQQTAAYESAGIRMDSLPVFNLFTDYIKENGANYGIDLEEKERLVIIPPDLGAMKRGKRFKTELGLKIIPVEKEGSSEGKIRISVYAKEDALKGKTGLIFDDIIESGKTLFELLTGLKRDYDLENVYIFASHPDFTDIYLLDNMYKRGLFEKIFVLDYQPLPEREFLVKVPVDNYLRDVIFNHHNNISVSQLYGEERI